MPSRRAGDVMTEPNSDSAVPPASALCMEFEFVHGEPVWNKTLEAYHAAAFMRNQAALCLSGGGLRSAAFDLGVLQALAQKGLLAQFHYLSTVGGGGFTGAWLSNLIHDRRNIDEVQKLLATTEDTAPVSRMREGITRLGARQGIMSADTWEDSVLWVRNLLLNWVIFLPPLLAVAMLPHAYARFLDSVPSGTMGWVLLGVALVCVAVAIAATVMALPSHAHRAREQGYSSRFIRFWIAAPMLVWAFLAPTAVLLSPPIPQPSVVVPATFVALMVGLWLAVSLRSPKALVGLLGHEFPLWFAANCVAALVLSVAFALFAAITSGTWQSRAAVAVFGPLSVASSHLVQLAIFGSLRGGGIREAVDRHWLVRLSALQVIPTLYWALLAGICIYLPDFVIQRWGRGIGVALCLAGLLAGLAACRVAPSSADNVNDVGKRSRVLENLRQLAVAFFAGVFFADILALLAYLGQQLVGPLLRADPSIPDIVSFGPMPELIVAVISLVIGLMFGSIVNTNNLTNHAVFRDRIVRTFLGAARRTRSPDGFTGFDPHDDPHMAALFVQSGRPVRLFQIVNASLSILGRQREPGNEGRVEAFTITPLFCGALGAFVPTGRYGDGERVSTHEEGGSGITLGTAVAISGAGIAAGYPSSAITAFLMTLFNVRLGVWLPNPARANRSELRRAQSPNAVRTSLLELFGRIDDRSDAIYLSDGGLFDNLGLYEVLRRRCRYVLVVDASADPEAAFTDLGETLRRAAIDLGVRVNFPQPLEAGRSYAIGTILYPEQEVLGELIYLKPVYPPDAPADIRAYAATSPAFPHEPGAHDNLTAAQFECYRRLGEFEMSGISPEPAPSLDGFFEAVRRADSFRGEPNEIESVVSRVLDSDSVTQRLTRSVEVGFERAFPRTVHVEYQGHIIATISDNVSGSPFHPDAPPRPRLRPGGKYLLWVGFVSGPEPPGDAEAVSRISVTDGEQAQIVPFRILIDFGITEVPIVRYDIEVPAAGQTVRRFPFTVPNAVSAGSGETDQATSVFISVYQFDTFLGSCRLGIQIAHG